MVKRIELGEYLRPLGEAFNGEERAGDEEQRCQDGADDVAEVLYRLRVAGDGDAEASPPEPGDPRPARELERGNGSAGTVSLFRQYLARRLVAGGR